LRRQHDDRAAISVAPHRLDRRASIEIGQAHIHDDEVEAVGLDAGLRGTGGFDRRDVEVAVDAELLDQRLAQVQIVLDDEKPADIRHQRAEPPAPPRRMR
jgi:hypothetical protein